MQRRYSHGMIVGGLIGMLIWSSCGSQSRQDSTPGTSSANASSEHSTPHPAASSELVSLSIDAASYHKGDSIGVTLSNKGAEAIFFADHQTNCSVILLEYQVNGAWTPLKNCTSKSRTIWHTLAAGQELKVELGAPRSSWPIGLCRVTVSYRMDQNIGSLTTVYSTSFVIEAS
jgi:hypothetical protein